MTDNGNPFTEEQLAEQHAEKNRAHLVRLRNEYAQVQLDIENDDVLDIIHYQELLAAIEARLSGEHVSDFLLSIHENIEGFDRVTGTSVDTPGVHIVSDVVSFFAHLARLVAFRKRQQALTLAEKVIVGLSVTGIVLLVVTVIFGFVSTGVGVLALGFILAGLAIGRAAISLGNIALSIHARKAELEKMITVDAVALKNKIDEELIKDPSKVDPVSLGRLVDEYVAVGYTIHRLRDGLKKARNVWPTRVHLAMASCVLVGAICLCIPPAMPFGALIIGIAGSISTITFIGDWFHRRREMRGLSPEDAKAMREKSRPPKTPKEKRYSELYHAAFLANREKASPLMPSKPPRRSLNATLVVDRESASPTLDDEHSLMDSTEVEMIELELASGSPTPKVNPNAVDPEKVRSDTSGKEPHIEPSPLHSARKKEEAEPPENDPGPGFDEKS